MTTKTYAIQRKDFVGAVYTVGYVIARDQAEADVGAAAHGPDARTMEIQTQGQMELAIEGIIDAANAATIERLHTAKFGFGDPT